MYISMDGTSLSFGYYKRNDRPDLLLPNMFEVIFGTQKSMGLKVYMYFDLNLQDQGKDVPRNPMFTCC